MDGITGNVDLDVGYVEYPDIIKTKGLKGFPKPVVVEEKAPVFEQAPPTPNVIKLRKRKIVTGIRKEPVTIFMNIM